MISYTSVILSKSGSSLSPSISAIIIGIIQFIGAYISTLLVDRLGRKVFTIQIDILHSIAIAIDTACSHLVWINSIYTL